MEQIKKEDSPVYTTFTTESQVNLPKNHFFYTIDERNWERLKKVVNKCNYKTNWWEVFTSAFLGISGSALITLLSISRSCENKIIRVVLICASISFFVLALICFFGSYSFRKNNKSSVELIKDELVYIEETFPK